MGKFGIGKSVRRLEDDQLLAGKGRYIDDLNLPDQARAVFLRSPHAHDKIHGVDTAAAAGAPGVLAVLTGAEYRDAGYGQLFSEKHYAGNRIMNKDGTHRADPGRWPLAIDRVRHVGDPVAMAIAETVDQAKDAAELIDVDFEALPAVTDIMATQKEGAPQVWDDVPGNLCFHWELGNEAATAAALATAPHITKIDHINNRLVSNAMEPRGALADCGEDGRCTLHLGTQNVHYIRDTLCEQLLGLAKDEMHVLTHDVGGGFGTKYYMYPEYPLTVWAAMKLRRPVKWTPDRAESFMSDAHGRDHVTHGELALDAEGRFIGLRVLINANMGAYLSPFAVFIMTLDGAPQFAGCYEHAAIYVEIRGVFTHTVPVDAYRGAGRPESNYTAERLVDMAARELGLSPPELRRRNFIPPEKMPYKTALLHTYDSGEYERNMNAAMERAGWSGFETRRAESQVRGKLRGLGMAYYMEATEGVPRDTATIEIGPEGGVTILAGTQATGQGHATAFAQVVADHLEVPFESISLIQGDSDRLATGLGTGGSRSILYSGGALIDASRKIIEKGKELAAEALEAAAVDIEYGGAEFVIRGTDRRIGIFEVAAQAAIDGGVLEAEGELVTEKAKEGLTGVGQTFPNGCHICEVEIDEETGVVVILRYTMVDDFGKVINPLILGGQVHGGVVAGIGQALCEVAVFDESSGQLLSGSFMDYCMPRADDLPAFDFSYNEIPCRNNPLGVKGCGEAGTIGAPPTVINAVIDALGVLGIKDIDMPVTPERMWRAIHNAKAA